MAKNADRPAFSKTGFLYVQFTYLRTKEWPKLSMITGDPVCEATDSTETYEDTG